MPPLLAASVAACLVIGVQHRALGADEPASAASQSSEINSPALSAASDQPPVNMDPVVVRSPKLPGILGKVLGYSWNVSEVTSGSNFHIRRGEIVDAIGFRHLYLAKNPRERAVVVVITRPPDRHVTQVVVAYSKNSVLHLKSAALGDIRPPGLIVADIDHPDKIREYVRDIRDSQLLEGGMVINYGGTDQIGIDRATGTRRLVTQGVLIAEAEESGIYSSLSIFGGQPLYRGSAQDMVDSAFHWLNDTDKVGLIPVALAKVDVLRLDQRPRRGTGAQTIIEDGVVFDWDGVHYFYNDHAGTLAMPIPRNPVTDAPYLVIRNGDLLESLYFLGTYGRQHPEESAALLPPLRGAPAAAAYTRSGRLWLMSPFLGRFAMLPASFKIEQTGALEIVHQALIKRELQKARSGTAGRPADGIAQALPGDSWNEQVRRAYLAFRDLGIPVRFVENSRGFPGVRVTYMGREYSYFSPEKTGTRGPNG